MIITAFLNTALIFEFFTFIGAVETYSIATFAVTKIHIIYMHLIRLSLLKLISKYIDENKKAKKLIIKFVYANHVGSGIGVYVLFVSS